MIGRLTGIVATTHKIPLIIDVNGVGYAVHVPQSEEKKLHFNDRVTIHIHTHVREDALDLYGFGSEEDLALFELLLTVSGIGPKTGLSIIERGARAIKKAVTSADTEFFTTIPRLGKKNAQKIIIELKNKLGGLTDLDLSESGGSETKELVSALTGMGFDRGDVIDVIGQLKPEDSIENKLRSALKLLGKAK